MLTTKTIEVTQQDIHLGQQCSSKYCPIALAAFRVFNDRTLYVGPEEIVIFNVYFLLPYEAIDFVEKFDRDRKSVQPFSFQLEVAE